MKSNSCFLGLIKYASGIFNYFMLPVGLTYGATVSFRISTSLKFFKFTLGVTSCLISFFKLMILFNINFGIKTRFCIARSAGTYCKIVERSEKKNKVLLEFPTKIKKWMSGYAYATSGRASNFIKKQETYGKAGYFRLKGVRPTVRGVAMNPVDHPHGGRTKTSSPEVTPWGRIAKHNR